MYALKVEDVCGHGKEALKMSSQEEGNTGICLGQFQMIGTGGVEENIHGTVLDV